MLDGQSAAHLSCKPVVSCWEEMLAHVWPRLKGYPSVQIPFSGWFEPLTCQNDRGAARPWCGRFCASERSEVRHHPAEFGTSVLGRFAPGSRKSHGCHLAQE